MSALINVEAESAMLGAMFQENKLIDLAADILEPEDFSEPLHGRIFSLIVGEYSGGKRPTPLVIKKHLEGDATLEELGGNTYLARLASDMSGIFGFKDVCKQLAELAARRRIAEGLRAAADACEALDVPIPEIVSSADAAISTKSGESIAQPTGAECIDELFQSHVGKHSGVKCGKIASLDKLMGPLRPKQMVIAAGRPGMGKTAFALSYALGAAEAGHGVMFVSLEMSGAELGARMVADLAYRSDQQPIPYSEIRDGNWRLGDRETVLRLQDNLKRMPFRVIDAASLTVGRLNMLIRRHARRMEANGQKLELVVVDYLQLLSPDSRGRSTYEAVSEISRGLKMMAKEHNIAVLALAQLSRSVETRQGSRPQLSDLRDSGQIEQDADAVMFLLRQEYYLRQEEPKYDDPKRQVWEQLMSEAHNKIEFILAKRRNGVTGSAYGNFYGEFQAVRG